tara:strand:- start:223 stop:795 length:573 start_codon:yes stop_codon:yes gene_type:complete
MANGFFPDGDPNRHIPAKQREYDTLSASSLIEETIYHDGTGWTDGTTGWDASTTTQPYKHLYTTSGQTLSGLIDSYLWGWDINANVLTSRSSGITCGALRVTLYDGLPGDDLVIGSYLVWCKKNIGGMGAINKCIRLDIPYRVKTGVITVGVYPHYISGGGTVVADTNSLCSLAVTEYMNVINRWPPRSD